MNIELINEQLSELQLLVQGWRDCDRVSEIEREIALDKLKRLYEDIKFGGLTPEKVDLQVVNLTASPLMVEGVMNEDAIGEDAIGEDAIDDDATEDNVMDEVATDEDVTEEEATEDDVIEESVTEDDATEVCITDNQSIDEIVEEPVEWDSFTEESVAEESITEESITEESIAEEPTPEDLVVVETQSDAEPKEESFISIALEDISIVADLENPDEAYEESTRDEAIHEEPIHKESIYQESIHREPIHEEPVEPQPEIVAEIHVTPTPKSSVDNALFDLATIPIRTKARRSAIMSLYSDGVKHTPQIPPQSYAQKPVEEPLLQLSDEREESKDEELAPIEELTLIETSTINTPNIESSNMETSDIESSNIDSSNVGSSNVGSSNIDSPNMESITIETITIDDTPTISSPKLSTFADAYVDNIETIGELYATNNSCAIGDVNIASSLSSINDRYLISQELFGGDMSSCEDMLAELTDIDNFDDAMIYIVENYEWNPDSEATMLIIKYLEQKFQIN